MKKISYEVKVGVIALLTIVVFIWVYNFLKGKDILQSTAVYYSVYDRIGGLEESSPVEVNGHKVGVVHSIDFINPDNGKLLVVFSIRKDFKIPKNSVAEITAVSVLGGMKVRFRYGDGPGFYNHGDTIPGILEEQLVDKVEKELIPLKNKLSNLIVSLDTVTNSINSLMDSGFKRNLEGTMANLNSTTGSLSRLVGSKEKELKSTLENVNKFSKMLADNSASMSKTVTNLGKITDTLSAADIYGSINKLKSTLENTSKMLDNMNKGKGTAGQLLTNDSLYTNLSNSLESLNNLLIDFKANPKRYVHFSVFGKKNTPSN